MLHPCSPIDEELRCPSDKEESMTLQASACPKLFSKFIGIGYGRPFVPETFKVVG